MARPVFLHEQPEISLCLVGVVRAAPQLDVARSRLAPARIGDDVVELEAVCLGTALTVRTLKHTSRIVALPDLAFDGRGDVAGVVVAGCRRARAVCLRHLLLQQPFKQRIQPALEYQGWVAVGNLVPQQGLGASELLVSVCAERDLDLIVRGRQWLLEPAQR